MKKATSKGATLKRLWRTLRKSRLLLVLSLLFSLLYVVAALLIPIEVGRVIDGMRDAFNYTSRENRILTGLGAILFFALIAALSQWVMSRCNTRVACRCAKSLRAELFNSLQKQPLSYLDGHPAGDLISRMISDVDQLTDGLLLGFSQLFCGVMTIIGTLLLLFYVHKLLAVVVVVLTPLSLLVASFIANRTFSMHQEQTASRGRLTTLINAYVGQQKTVRAFGTESLTREQFEQANQHYAGAGLRAIFFSSLVNPTTRFVNNVVYAVVAIIGMLLISAGTYLGESKFVLFLLGDGLTAGTLIAALTYAGQYAKPFNEISGVISELQSALVCAERIYEWMDVPPETDTGTFATEEPDGTVQLKDVSFRYEQSRPLLQDISLKAGRGQRIAIVGPTGCGKTTLINLLMRYYDADEGLIEISGHSIRDWSRQGLRSVFGMVLQDTWLKNGTVLENLRLGKPDATREEVMAAAEVTHAHHFITTLPQGYDTPLREDGGTLSAGQKQLLCITRVLLRQPAMLLLDEATSSLDSRTELLVQKAFDTLMKDRTSFIVAHRLSTIEHADLILVMKDGRVIEQGRHEALLRQDGFYRKLYYSQFAGTDE